MLTPKIVHQENRDNSEHSAPACLNYCSNQCFLPSYRGTDQQDPRRPDTYGSAPFRVACDKKLC
jgi:hypothetical protein